MCYFLSCLLTLKDQANRLGHSPASQLPAKFPGVPLPLLNGILDTFTQPIADKRKVTEKLQTKLIAWICVVYLHLSDLKADIGIVSKELGLQPNK